MKRFPSVRSVVPWSFSGGSQLRRAGTDSGRVVILPSRQPPAGARFAVLLPIFLALLALTAIQSNIHAQAQAFTASLSGVIADASGAAVPGATVTLNNPDKGFTRTYTTAGDGSYSFTLVPPGTYELKVEKQGFRPYTQKGIILAVGQAATQNVTIQLGSVTQEVTVTAAAPLLNTTNANVSSDVTQRQTVELPLNLRNVFGLVALNSSVNNS
jgi:hypothetical protein